MADEKRVRKGFESGTLGALLADDGLTITFAVAPGFDTLAADEHIALTLDPEGVNGAPEIVYLTAYTADATTGTIARAQEGTVAREHANASAWLHGPTVRDHSAGRVAFAERASTSIELNSVTWANVDTGLDLVLTAQEGDIIEYGVSAQMENDNVITRLDVICVASGASFGSSDQAGTPGGAMGWWCINGQYVCLAGSIFRRLLSGDVGSGVVTLRFRYQTASAAARTLYATADFPLQVWAKNHGPQEA